MKNRLSEFWDWNKEFIIGSLVTVSVISAGVFALFFVFLVGWSNQYKVDCELATGPSLSTTYWTNDSTYAYDPEGFCAKLRERIANE